MPAAWPTGAVTGLVARGGYVVDLAWNQGKITRVRISSRLGGNCRVRVHSPVVAAGRLKLRPAQGDNSNPFYETSVVKPPLVSAQTTAKQPALAPSVVYDFPTQAGQAYELKAQ
ncbi:glycoside hydrolase family 95-like protein [Hymenobacter volaticus]|uniref:glycoside hydrolase family 95-like protein n=1 Tax=Hymenobacter volaticus TaxID=2932254 RepID=UPI0035CA0172